MSPQLAPRPYLYQVPGHAPLEFEHAPKFGLTAHLSSVAPSSWLWCADCERTFTADAIRSEDAGARCGYHDCAGEPLDFWSWEAYRAFVGHGPAQPVADRRYPLAA